MAISLTEWWQNLLNNLQYIDQRFSQLELAKTSSFIALTKMANLGINLENPNNSLFDLKSLDERIQKHEKSLTYLFTNPLNQQSYRLPAIDSPATSLIALIYLLHLKDFHKIQSSVALIQNGVQLLGKNGVSQNKPLVAENTEHYLAYVSNALAQHQQSLLEQGLPCEWQQYLHSWLLCNITLLLERIECSPYTFNLGWTHLYIHHVGMRDKNFRDYFYLFYNFFKSDGYNQTT